MEEIVRRNSEKTQKHFWFYTHRSESKAVLTLQAELAKVPHKIQIIQN